MRALPQEVLSCEKSTEGERRFNLRAGRLAGILIRRHTRTGATTLQCVMGNLFTFIALSGNWLMALFKKRWWCITKTAIPSTMYSRTLSLCLVGNTFSCMELRCPRNEDKTYQSVWTKLGVWRVRGIVHQKEELGIAYTGNWPGKTANRLAWYVNIVESPSRHWRRMETQSSALTIASRRHGVNRAWTMNPASVEIAEKSLLSTNTPKHAFVHVSVLNVIEDEMARPVYNLTIDSDPGEYYANGLLVRNCDALRYAGVGAERVTKQVGSHSGW